MKETSASYPTVVVVGGGFGGLNVARRLANRPVTVILVDRQNYHLFQPLLYQVATAALSPAQIASPIRSILRSASNVRVVMDEVEGIDAQRRVVCCKRQEISYDYLVLATGATPFYFAHPAWRQHAPSLKTIGDAVRIRKKILVAFELAEMETNPEVKQALLTFAIVGAGPTGVELAGAIAELSHRALAHDFRRIDPHSTRILLVEVGPRILGSFPEELSSEAAKVLRKLGVDIYTNRLVQTISPDGLQTDREFVPARLVLWAAGVVATPAGKWLNVETDGTGRVIVTESLTLPGHPHIFVIGDAAHVKNERGEPLPGVAPVAIQEGCHVARAILDKIKGRASPPFRYSDKGALATVGRSFAVAQFRELKLSGWLAWVAWTVVHIYYLIGFKNRLLVMLEWFWAYLTFQRGARLITSDGEDDKPDHESLAR